MVYIKLFNTEQDRQACTDKYEYLSYTVETDEVNIHPEEPPFFCKLTLNNGDVVEIEGSGELTSAMTNSYKTTTVSAKIGDLCTSIGYNAFHWWEGLTSITISNNVTSIGNWALDYTPLSSIVIPDSVTSIGETAFSNCSRLTSVTIGNGVTSISNYAFYGCSSLSSITIPNGVTSIGDTSFMDCYSLSSITIPNSVTGISDNAFDSCMSLTSVTIGNSVTSIGNWAFKNCSSLSTITSLATTAPTIGVSTFRNVNNNGTLYVPSGSSGYDVWMGTGNYYLGKYNWTKVEQ